MRIPVGLFFALLSWQVWAGDFSTQAKTLPNSHLLSETVVTSGQPDAAQLQRLAEDGLAAVINLRTAGEDPGYDEAAVLQAADVAYYRIPVDYGNGLTRGNVARLDRLLARHAGQPVLVHCASGNRVGALFALRAHWLQGEDPAAALQHGRQAGLTRLEGLVSGLLADE